MTKPKAKIAVLLVLPAFLLAGCDTIVRENIIASIDTGIGASVAENKQTQMYELKAGYINSQFYSIPTGKVVANEKNAANDMRTNRADITPQVVSGIHVKTSLADVVLGMEVSENFAVGSDAVKSAAASAMYIADAKDPASAKAASDAVQSKDSADAIAKNLDDPAHQQNLATLNDLLKKSLTKKVTAHGTDFKVTDPASAYADALAADKGETITDIKIKPSLNADLQDIMTKLQAATD
jgi:hypothetical protein